MERLLEKIADEERVKSVLLWKSGAMQYEYYAQCSGEDSLEPINSITKTVLSLLIGIAIDKGIIDGLDGDIRRYVPDAKSNTLLEHITMTSGMDWGDELIEEPYNRELLSSSSWISYICSKDLLEKKRGQFKYNGGSSHLLSKALSEASGVPVEDFARDHLFSKLGIECSIGLDPIEYKLSSFSWKRSLIWDKDPEGNNIGSFGLSLKARDLLKLGELILGRGKFRGDTIVSSKYIEDMTKPKVKAGLTGYGNHIWVRKIRGVETVSALGYGNQYLTVIPKHRTTIAILSKNDGDESPDIDRLHGELVKAVSKEQ
jgi:CubicO group peptidase (beta-lactamase class C family)